MKTRYVGTFYGGHSGPQDVMVRGGRITVQPAFGRRKNRLDRAREFCRACRLWWRVQRLGSRA